MADVRPSVKKIGAVLEELEATCVGGRSEVRPAVSGCSDGRCERPDADGASGPTTDILIDMVGCTTATAAAPAQPAAGGTVGESAEPAEGEAAEVVSGTQTFRWICQSATSDNGAPAFVISPTMSCVFVPN